MKYVADKNGHWIPLERTVSETHYVQPDLAEFRLPGGKAIGGRRQWREHLKRTNTVEMGHSDIRQAEEKWNAKKAAFAERTSRGHRDVRPADTAKPITDMPDYERSRVNREVRNRLEGRPAPDRITLIKMTLEEARRHR